MHPFVGRVFCDTNEAIAQNSIPELAPLFPFVAFL